MRHTHHHSNDHHHRGERADGEHAGRRFVRGMFGMGRDFRHGPRGSEHGGMRRLFEHGDLRFVILQLIADKPQHGYELIKAIEEKVAGAYAPSPGVVYPTLTMLEELGYVVVAPSEGTKKLFSATEEGRAFLEANRPAVAAIFQRMTEAGAAMGGGLSPQILRAMENLKMALRMRLSRGHLQPENVQALVTVLDQAARAIEQS